MSGLLERYHALVAAGELRPDAEQAAAAERLAQLQLELEAPPAAAGLVNRLLGRKPPPRPRGLYLWGGVGWYGSSRSCGGDSHRGHSGG